MISSIAIPVPDNWSNSTFEISKCSAPTFLMSLTQFLDNIPYIHITISFSKNSKSSNGSWLPGSTGFPSRSVEPEASITLINTLACIKSSKNLLPNPFPSCAPGTKPATSIISIGSNLFPSIQIEL